MKPSSLGDVVHALPCAAILRRAYPDARIRWLVNTEWLPLLLGNPHVDHALEFPRRDFRGAGSVLRVARWARALRKDVHADLILDYQGLLRSALIARLCRHKGARVVGLSDAREASRLFYDCTVDTTGWEHAVDRYLALTRAAIGDRFDMSAPEWHLPPGEAPAGFAPAERFILLHPFSRGAGKSLSPGDVAEFCSGLISNRVVIVGRSRETLPDIANACDLLNKTTLLELIWLLRHATFTISVDSGPMHIAAALTDRLISIHTWSDPARVGPYRQHAWVWKNGKLFAQRDRENANRWREVANFSALAEFVKTQL